MIKKIILLPLIIFSISCSQKESSSYTLYRSGINMETNTVDETLRIYVSTFSDKSGDDSYNQGNCLLLEEVLNKEQVHYKGSIYSNFKIKYWCEKGVFKE